jgi:hypothetical protein
VSSFALLRTVGQSMQAGDSTINALINPVIVDVLEFSERLDDVQIVLSPAHDIFRSTVDTIIKDLQRLDGG